MIDREFTPKSRLDKWRVAFSGAKGSGYDFVFMVENPETKVGYTVEIGITEDGRLCGQVTPDEGATGPDALLLFNASPGSAEVSGNNGGPRLVIDSDPRVGTNVVEEPYPKQPSGFY